MRKIHLSTPSKKFLRKRKIQPNKGTLYSTKLKLPKKVVNKTLINWFIKNKNFPKILDQFKVNKTNIKIKLEKRKI